MMTSRKLLSILIALSMIPLPPLTQKAHAAGTIKTTHTSVVVNVDRTAPAAPRTAAGAARVSNFQVNAQTQDKSLGLAPYKLQTVSGRQ